MDDPPFTLTEAEAIHQAFSEAMADAKEREERMPSSAAALRARAENILRVRNKILATLPEYHRRNYPPWNDAAPKQEQHDNSLPENEHDRD